MSSNLDKVENIENCEDICIDSDEGRENLFVENEILKS